MTLHAGTRLGPYEIQSLIGSGGMGEVYRALDTRLQRPVAIKVLPEELISSASAMERFQREARTASVLNHPNICTIYDVGATDPPFIAMELLEGESLQHRLRRGPLDLASFVNIAIAATEGLEAAHSHRFIHRDIKPANIFLTSRGPKLLDFGLAKAHVPAPVTGLSTEKTRPADALLTDSGVTVGTIAYMSPEQLTGKELDSRTDVFSLGLVLYEMVTGRPAFTGNTSAAISGAILYEQPVPPIDIVRDLPTRVNDIILKALEKDREDRYQTAADLRADLRRLRREIESHPAHSTAELSGTARRSAHSAASLPSDKRIALDLIKRHRAVLLVSICGLIGAFAVAIVLLLGSRAARSGSSSDTPSPLSLENVQFIQLTTSGDAERPAIAPDGKYLAYVRRQKGEYSLHVRQTATAATAEIVKAEPNVTLFGGTVSPDGGFVDYIRRVQGQSFELWRVSFLGGAARRLLDRVNSPIAWSPDGRRFAFVRADASRGTTAVVLIDAGHNGERVLAERQRPAQFFSLMMADRPAIAPAWAPNGRLLAIPGAGAGDNPSQGDIAFIDVDTGTLRTTVLPTNAIRGLVWFDDTTLLLNAGLEKSPLQLHELSYPTGRLSVLTRDVNDYDGISLAADGRTLVCTRRERRIDLSVLDTTGRTVANAPGMIAAESLNWAGDRVMYGTWTWSPGGAPQQLLQDAQYTTASSDDRTLVFSKGNGLWKADGDGGHLTLLVSGDAWLPTITPDNRHVIFVSARTGQQSPWIVPIDGGEPRQLVDLFTGGPGIDISPDGKSIVVPTFDQQQNRRMAIICDLADCGHQKSLPGLGASRLRWTPDGRAIAYIESGTQTNLWTVPVGGGAPSQLTHFEDRTIIDFDWSRDGKRLAVARANETNDIVVLKGLRR